MYQRELKVPRCIASKPCASIVLIRFRVQILLNGRVRFGLNISLSGVAEC